MPRKTTVQKFNELQQEEIKKNPKTRLSLREHVVKGEMRVKLIPAKDGKFRVYEPMVALYFHMEGGDELNIFVNDSKHAPAIYKHFVKLLSSPDRPDGAHFIRNLYIPTFNSDEE